MQRWSIYGKLITGKTFLGSKEKCEDKFNFVLGQEFFCIAVADGAGSCQYADIGAELAGQTVCKLFKKKFDAFYSGKPIDVKKQVMEAILYELGKASKRKRSQIKQFSSTLLFVAVKKNRILAGHIGDGLIAVKRDDKYVVLSEPENGDESNETFFTTSKDYLSHLRLYRGEIENIKSFALLTDGACNGYYRKVDSTLTELFCNEIGGLFQLKGTDIPLAIETLLKEKVSQRTLDDCCIVIAKCI